LNTVIEGLVQHAVVVVVVVVKEQAAWGFRLRGLGHFLADRWTLGSIRGSPALACHGDRDSWQAEVELKLDDEGVEKLSVWVEGI
jgi:hypothetical protein